MPQNIPTWEFLYTKYFFPEMQLGSLEKQDLTPLTETTSQLENNGIHHEVVFVCFSFPYHKDHQ